MAHSMSPEEFRDALAEIGYSQERFSELVGASRRTGQKWALGEARLPNAVVILLQLFRRLPKALQAVEAMQPLPTRARARARTTAKRGAKKAA